MQIRQLNGGELYEVVQTLVVDSGVYYFQISDDGSLLVVINSRKELSFLECQNGTFSETSRVALPQVNFYVQQLAFDSSGQSVFLMVNTDDETLYLYNVVNRTTLDLFQGFEGYTCLKAILSSDL